MGKVTIFPLRNRLNITLINFNSSCLSFSIFKQRLDSLSQENFEVDSPFVAFLSNQK